MVEGVDGADIFGHLAVPFDDVGVERRFRLVVSRNVVDLVPKLPTNDIGGISPTCYDVANQVFGNPFGLFVGEKHCGRLQSKHRVVRVVVPSA